MSNVISFQSDLTQDIIGHAIDVHRQLGPGLLESVYETCLNYKLEKAGFDVKRQLTLPVKFDDIVIDQGFRIDLLINDQIILELKSCEKILPIHKAQLITYLKLAKKPVGLLMNFNEQLLKNGIERLIRKEFMKAE